MAQNFDAPLATSDDKQTIPHTDTEEIPMPEQTKTTALVSEKKAFTPARPVNEWQPGDDEFTSAGRGGFTRYVQALRDVHEVSTTPAL